MRKMASRVEGTVRAAGGRSQTGERNTRDGENKAEEEMDVNKRRWGMGIY